MLIDKFYAKRVKIVYIFACLMAIVAQSGITLYLPSFPDIKISLHTTNHYVSLTLSAYLLGYAVAILLWGNISDNIGRKKTLLSALFLFSITSFLIHESSSIREIILLRFFQGGAGGGCVIVARIALRDMLTGNELSKAMSMVSIAFVLSLGVSQFLGGYMVIISSWRSEFLMLTLLSAVSFLLLLLFFPETNQKTARQNENKIVSLDIFKTYFNIIKKVDYLWLTISGSVGYGITIAFNSISPFLLQSKFHLTTVQYGFIGFFISFSYLAGSLFNSRYIVKCNAIKFVFFGLVLIFLSGLCMFSVGLFKSNIYLIVVPIVIAVFGQSIVYPNIVTLMLNDVKNDIGSSMAFFGFVQQLIGASVGVIAAYCPHDTELPLNTVTFILGIMGFLSFCRVKELNYRNSI